MKSSTAIHYFSQKETVSKKADKSVLGIRGRQANEFAELGLPVLPGFIIDSTLAPSLAKEPVFELVKPSLVRCQDLVGKVFGDTGNPLLLKIVISPNLAVANYPTLHNFGLAKSTIAGFEKWVGANFAAHEVCFLLRGVLSIEKQIAELEENAERLAATTNALKDISSILKTRTRGRPARHRYGGCTIAWRALAVRSSARGAA